MGATVKNIYVKYTDNNLPVYFSVLYSDNGYSDQLSKSFNNNDDAIKWLNMWYSDLAGGAEHLEHAKTIVNNLNN